MNQEQELVLEIINKLRTYEGLSLASIAKEVKDLKIDQENVKKDLESILKQISEKIKEIPDVDGKITDFTNQIEKQLEKLSTSEEVSKTEKRVLRQLQVLIGDLREELESKINDKSFLDEIHEKIKEETSFDKFLKSLKEVKLDTTDINNLDEYISSKIPEAKDNTNDLIDLRNSISIVDNKIMKIPSGLEIFDNGRNLGRYPSLNFINAEVIPSASRIDVVFTGTGTGTGTGGGNYIVNQTPDNGTYSLLSGAVNGSNTVFTVSTSEYVTGTMIVMLNGVALEQGTDWTETSPTLGTITFTTAPITGDTITVIFQSEASDGVYLESVVAGTNITIDNTDPQNPIINATGGGGISDGDKGDISVTSSGTVWTIDNLAVTNAKINDVAWSKITGTPTTLSGYGITDAIDGSGSANRIAFFSDSNTLTTDADFSFNGTTNQLTVGGLTASGSGGLLLEASNGTDVGILGAANTANVEWYGSHNFNTVTASRVAQFGASKTLESSSVTTTELGYVSGVTSAIQTQLDAKAPLYTPTFLSYTGGSVATTSTSWADIHSSATWTISATGTYMFYVSMVYDAAATTTGAGFAVNGPTNNFLNNIISYDTVTTDRGAIPSNVYDFNVPAPSSRGTTDNHASIQGTVRFTNTGTLAIRFRTEVGGSAITVKTLTGYLIRIN